MISHVQCCVANRIRVRLNANVCIFERLETVGNGWKMRTMVDTVWRGYHVTYMVGMHGESWIGEGGYVRRVRRFDSCHSAVNRVFMLMGWSTVTN